MSEYMSTPISYYPASVYETVPLGVCTLEQMLNAIKNPKPEVLTVFKKIEEASKAKDAKLKAELKSKLFYFNPCCTTDHKGRKYENIVSYNSLMLIDLDNLEEERAVLLKQWLFDQYDCIIACFLSASKRGLKAIVRIPQATSVDDFKSYFYGIASELQWIEGWDGSAQSPILPNYLTYDRDILIRTDATVWLGRGYKEDEFKQYTGETVVLEDITEEDRQEIREILRKGMEKITDQGHFICRSVCIAAGGYVGAGYFDADDMRDYMFELIEATPYLRAKLRAYKLTCTQMLEFGSRSALYLDRHETAEA